jgi:hypothetical protein
MIAGIDPGVHGALALDDKGREVVLLADLPRHGRSPCLKLSNGRAPS